MTAQGNWLARTWRQRGPVACSLWPLSMLYWLISALHRQLYRSGIFKTEHCAVPVIVVGNVVAGGAGKTPLVIALAKHLQKQGLQVGVVSRGYGRQDKNCLEVLKNTPVSASGDEPALVLRAIKKVNFSAPVFVATRRMDAVHALLAKYPATQVIISDDGLQHHSMARDIEITVFDDRGIGNGWLLPAGPMRERWTSHRKNGLVLHTGQSPAFNGFTSDRRLADYAVDAAGHQVALSGLRGQALTALAAIANPTAFFDMLTARGLTLNNTISLPDHFDFEGYRLPNLPDSASMTVLCTEKDAVKLFALPIAQKCRLLAVPLEFVPERAFLNAVDGLLRPLLAKTAYPPSNLPSQHGVKHGHETA
jgi:tetraacyldisaccharide 4'-kinase